VPRRNRLLHLTKSSRSAIRRSRLQWLLTPLSNFGDNREDAGTDFTDVDGCTYVLKQKLKGQKRYPFVLMLEPLFRCNLACAGCGQNPISRAHFENGIEPGRMLQGRGRVRHADGFDPRRRAADALGDRQDRRGAGGAEEYIYLCTNALLLKEKLHLFKPSKYLTFSVHVDGQKEHHDFSVCREGGYELAIEGIREAVKQGFRVTTNTTLFDGADPKSVRAFFDE